MTIEDEEEHYNEGYAAGYKAAEARVAKSEALVVDLLCDCDQEVRRTAKAEARVRELEAKITKTLDRLDHSSLHDHADISSARAWLRDALQQKAPTP